MLQKVPKFFISSFNDDSMEVIFTKKCFVYYYLLTLVIDFMKNIVTVSIMNFSVLSYVPQIVNLTPVCSGQSAVFRVRRPWVQVLCMTFLCKKLAANL